MISKVFATFVAVLLTAFVLVSKAPAKDDSSITLTSNNTVVLSGVVDGPSVGQLIYDAKKLDTRYKLSFKKEPIYLFLNTPGGSIQSGLELMEALNGLSRTVSTITLFSASMGFQIVQGLDGDRLILKNGVLMSHRAAGEISGSFGGQKPSQMENRYALWYSRIQELDEQTVKRTNGKQTLASYQKAYSDELWLTGTQSVAQGYADRIVKVRCDSSLSGTTEHNVDFLGISISYDLDNCPINTAPMNVRMLVGGKVVENEKAEEIKAKFMEQYLYRMNTAVPTRW